MSPSRNRAVTAVAVAASAFAAVILLPLAGSVPAGAADGRQSPNPTLDPATVEATTTTFALRIDGGATCDGTGGAGWRAHTFIVDATDDPAAIDFVTDSSLPPGNPGDDRDASDGSVLSALFKGNTRVINLQPAASPAGLINPDSLTGFTFSAESWALVTGNYKIGVACVDPAGTTRQWWDMTVAVDTSTAPFLKAAQASAEPAATTVAVTAAPTSAKVGSEVTFTATVTPIAAAGSLELLVDGASEGSKPATNGAATWTIDDLTEGTKAITAKFTPTDAAAYKISTSEPLSYMVAAAAAKTTTVALSADPATKAAQGQSVGLTATLTPSDAVGKVTFKDGTTSLGPAVDVKNGIAKISTTGLPLGTRSLRAEFVPTDAKEFTASTGTLSYVVEASTAQEVAVTLVVEPADKAPVGQDVLFTATIDPKVAGEVQFLRAVPAPAGDGGSTTTTTASTSTTTSTSTSTTVVATSFASADVENEGGDGPVDAAEAGTDLHLEPLADAIGVAEGKAVLTMKNLAPGEYEIYAVFTPEDTEAYKVSTSDALLYTIEAAAAPSTTAPTGSTPTTVFAAVSDSGEISGGSLPVTGGGLLLAGGGIALLYLGRVLYLMSRPVEESSPS